MQAELSRLRLGVRLLSVVLALDLAKNFASPALWIMGETGSVVSTVARLATYPQAMAWVFVVAAGLVLPYVAVQLVAPCARCRRHCTQWACRGLLIGSVLWVYMAYLGRNLDYEIATMLFLVNGAMGLAMAAILGYGINLEQLAAEDAQGLCA